MKKKAPSTRTTSPLPTEPEFLKSPSSKPDNNKVGQVFVTSVKKLSSKQKRSLTDNKGKWSEDSFSLVPSNSVCGYCVHYGTAGNCDAFNVIPDSILYKGARHDKPLPGQGNKIVFERREEI